MKGFHGCKIHMLFHFVDWKWSKDSLGGNPIYKKILEMFADQKSSCYSIHQIGKFTHLDKCS